MGQLIKVKAYFHATSWTGLQDLFNGGLAQLDAVQAKDVQITVFNRTSTSFTGFLIYFG